MWETRDPDGRRVVLASAGWLHVRRKHPDLRVTPAALLAAVASPDQRVAGREASEEWFYARGAGPSSWLKVVVHYVDDRGLIVTAFARRSFP